MATLEGLGTAAEGPEMVIVISRDSDESGEEMFSEESDLSSFNSEAEELSSFSSDESWKPEDSLQQPDRVAFSESVSFKRPHRVAFPASISKEEGPPRRPGRRRGRGRGRGRATATVEPSASPEEAWLDESQADLLPAQPVFRPAHAPGPTLNPTASHTVLQLFQLFFTNAALQTIVSNTNEYGRVRHAMGANPWTDVTLEDMHSFLALVIYMGIVKVASFPDYWRKGKLYSLMFPQGVMPGKKFYRLSASMHMSSSAVDAANDQQRGTPTYDHLCKIKPLYEEIRAACKENYHPAQTISIHERIVASKSRVGLMKQCRKNKPARWGYRLFLLADSTSGYTWDFVVCEGRKERSGKGLGYECVKRLMDTSLLGTGYTLFVDNFYTSPVLFSELLEKKIWACGTVRPNRSGFPQTKVNSLSSRSARGSVRWIRKDSLLFVQWKDSRDVSVCSTLHSAHGADTVSRRVKGDDGQWTTKNLPIPPAIVDYNKHMGGVDPSDALITYYQVLHKSRKWYKTFLYHFVEIAAMNAFILHKELATCKGQKHLTQKAFRETLAEQLAVAGSASNAAPAPAPSTTHHRPVHITGQSRQGRLRCRHCHAKTPVKCSTCDVSLCFVLVRDCYNAWHTANNM